MIPICCAVTADYAANCYADYHPNNTPRTNYYSTLEKAHKETISASCTEQVFTGVALAALVPCCFGIPPRPLTMTLTTPLYIMQGLPEPFGNDRNYPRTSISNFTISTGCIRDCILIQKTFRPTPTFVLPSHHDND